MSNARKIRRRDVVVGTAGRPQVPHPAQPAAPAPTIRRCRFRSYIVGAGEVWKKGGDPCGRPCVRMTMVTRECGRQYNCLSTRDKAQEVLNTMTQQQSGGEA